MARAIWEPRIAAVSAAWREAELSSVEVGVRPAALLALGPAELPALSERAHRRSLAFSVVAAQPLSDGYSAAAPIAGAPGLRVAFHRRSVDAHEAWAAGDAAIGEMLGFPPCCRDFFVRTWGAGQRDPTRAQLAGGTAGPPECNTLLRWLGARLVPHLPCSFGCGESAALGAAMAELIPALEREWGQEMLSWRMAYSASGGVGIVETPAFRFAFSTDPGEFRAEREGNVDVRMALDHIRLPASAMEELWPHSWEDNGFSKREAMTAAHAIVERAVLQACNGTSRRPLLVDLGCGDGALLALLYDRFGGGDGFFGLDCDDEKISRGRARHPFLNLKVDRIEAVSEPTPADREAWDVVILMPGRLAEMSPREAARTARAILYMAKHVVIYAYGDWLRNGDLASLCELSGLGRPASILRGAGVEAGVL